jgi:hypothetical protein
MWPSHADPVALAAKFFASGVGVTRQMDWPACEIGRTRRTTVPVLLPLEIVEKNLYLRRQYHLGPWRIGV